MTAHFPHGLRSVDWRPPLPSLFQIWAVSARVSALARDWTTNPSQAPTCPSCTTDPVLDTVAHADLSRFPSSRASVTPIRRTLGAQNGRCHQILYRCLLSSGTTPDWHSISHILVTPAWRGRIIVWICRNEEGHLVTNRNLHELPHLAPLNLCATSTRSSALG
ncbi:uncharacterized protein LY89DRAFT_368333 [Mollisia scopiformis]|uniref:Uncharacterized protein n=1 Tax=Mollisia scopiformis TaxID=149040 RepID=A0A132B3Z4_MOLSC|nr:uncharacterized protein LY89DRAFT_368333 [Mollisia scopiformis]KUJ07106.1 hypothetical protein LY89DRAFT_368333 [Mollisia scopiformis]